MATKSTIVTNTMTAKTDPNNFHAYDICLGAEHGSTGLHYARPSDAVLFGFWWVNSRSLPGCKTSLPPVITVIEHVWPPYTGGPVVSSGYDGPAYAFEVDGIFYVREGRGFRGYKTCHVS